LSGKTDYRKVNDCTECKGKGTFIPVRVMTAYRDGRFSSMDP